MSRVSPAQPDEAAGGAPDGGALPSQLNTALDALSEEWGSALPLIQARWPKYLLQRNSCPSDAVPPRTQAPARPRARRRGHVDVSRRLSSRCGARCTRLASCVRVAERRPRPPLLQVWLPKARGQRGGSWLSVDGAPFRMSDAALLPFRERRRVLRRLTQGLSAHLSDAFLRSGELCFCRGQGLPGRVWATGACEVIQDCQFVSVQQYSRRTLACTEGLQETICVPVYLRTAPNAPAPASDDGPVGVIEVVLASSQHAANGSMLAIEGRVRLSAGGTAAVITSIGTALDAAGLSVCADKQHHGYSGRLDTAPSQQAPPEATAGTARSSFDAARIAAGFEETSGSGSDGSNNGSTGTSNEPRRYSLDAPRRSGSMARTSSYRSFNGASTISPSRG